MKSKKTKVDKVNTSTNIFDHVTLKDMPKVGDTYRLRDREKHGWWLPVSYFKVAKVDIVHRDGTVIDGVVAITDPWHKDIKPHHMSLKEFLKTYEKSRNIIIVD